MNCSHCSRSTAYFSARRMSLLVKGSLSVSMGRVMCLLPLVWKTTTPGARFKRWTVLRSKLVMTSSSSVCRALVRAFTSEMKTDSTSSKWARPSFQ